MHEHHVVPFPKRSGVVSCSRLIPCKAQENHSPPNQWNSDSPMELDDESQQGADGLSPVTVKVNTELPRIQIRADGMNQEPCGSENE